MAVWHWYPESQVKINACVVLHYYWFGFIWLFTGAGYIVSWIGYADHCENKRQLLQSHREGGGFQRRV